MAANVFIESLRIKTTRASIPSYSAHSSRLLFVAFFQCRRKQVSFRHDVTCAEEVSLELGQRSCQSLILLQTASFGNSIIPSMIASEIKPTQSL